MSFNRRLPDPETVTYLDALRYAEVLEQAAASIHPAYAAHDLELRATGYRFRAAALLASQGTGEDQ